MSADSLGSEQERIQNELDALTLERQWVITQAHRAAISESDMDYQLGALTLQEISLKREFASIEQAEYGAVSVQVISYRLLEADHQYVMNKKPYTFQ